MFTHYHLNSRPQLCYLFIFFSKGGKTMNGFITETLTTPIVAETDIVVMGGGPAGVTAAVAAARLGADVILIERWGHFGGQATGGLVIEFFGAADAQPYETGRKIKAGIYEETLDRLRFYSAVTRFPDVLIHPEYLKLVYQQMILESRINPFAHTMVVGAQTRDEKIVTVQVENKSGRGAISGKVFIDCTGDGDSAKWCGVPHELLPADQLLPVTLVYRFGNVDIERARKFTKENLQEYSEIMGLAKQELGFSLAWNPTMNRGEVWTDEAHLNNIDCSKAEDMMQSEFWGREKAASALEFYRKHIPGFEEAVWVDTAPQMGTRESRRIRGKYWLTIEDCDAGRQFEDTVLLNPYRAKGTGHVFGLPYRCLVPNMGPKNLIFAGRCVSVAHDALDRIREIPSCMCMGQAAGTGAALALDVEADVGAMDTNRLRSKLLDAGAILEI